MSMGERSCKFYANNCPVRHDQGREYNPYANYCDINCEHYIHDGVTKPDTYVKIENPDTPQRIVKEKQIPIKTIGGKKCLDLHRLSNAELLEVAAHFKVTIINKHRREMIRKLEKHGPFVFNKQ